MNEPIIYIEPERLAKWKRNAPLFWHEALDAFERQAIIQRGSASPEYLREGCARNLQMLINLYDMTCRTERQRQKMRKGFRELTRNPVVNTINFGLQQRLDEHAAWVARGMEEPDPDEDRR